MYISAIMPGMQQMKLDQSSYFDSEKFKAILFPVYGVVIDVDLDYEIDKEKSKIDEAFRFFRKQYKGFIEDMRKYQDETIQII